MKYLEVRRGKGTGKNNVGKITVEHRGGGTRRKVLSVDSDLKHREDWLKVIGVKYNIDKSCEIGIVRSLKKEGLGEKRYILMSKGIKVGDVLNMNKYIKKVEDLKVGDQVCNIDSKYIKSGGLYGVVVSTSALLQRGRKGRVTRVKNRREYDVDNIKVLRLRGRRLKEFDNRLTVRRGVMSSTRNKFIRDGFVRENIIELKVKAGDKRRLGFRPKVRMKAMNAVDRKYSFKKGIRKEVTSS